MPRKKAKSKTSPRKSLKKPAKKVVIPRVKKRKFLLFFFSAVCIGITILVFLNIQRAKSEAGVLAQVTALTISFPEKKESPAQVPALSARGVYVLDVESGKVLFEKNSDSPVLPASTTKIATALTALKAYNPQEILTVGRVRTFGSKMGLVEGEQISVENLLHGLLINSANDAAEVLAGNYSGGRAAFIEEMNKVARESGLSQTHFTNPAGFDEYLHFSTARDLTALALIAYEDPSLAKIVGMNSAEVTSSNGLIKHNLYNTNQLLGSVPGVIGIKTGHTTTSGESLVTLIRRDKHDVIIALMGSTDRFSETKQLIDWIWENYEWQVKDVPLEELEN